ncbi:Crp/Fnr family transcriptional regulator [Flavobacterium hydatis]|uniref:Cyclic nucleotide-binding protein n=1 Tax=Flavobacterium hydatis TaxID=991 RepID=A0A085ZVT6_FLAHY|nr:Crp/Fnr family transcriptional regulator [Flavobacterium hydatis]KFF08550.1 cyclic nucleotide-binding protein [Flavobacterium hydatis]OXA91043.1 cyclic nucleotide-binding protein [Flavobacterium hydatis]
MKSIFQSLQILPSDELDKLDGLITKKKLKKGDFLIQESQMSKEIVLIKSGALRSFYINNEGEEITNCITFENEFMAAFASFITQKPTEENIQALFDTELEVISHANIEHLYENSIHWQKVGRIIAEMQYINLEQRILSFQKLTGKERYETLFKNHPNYIQLIPLQYLASFLGVTPRHLSRIRKAIL